MTDDTWPDLSGWYPLPEGGTVEPPPTAPRIFGGILPYEAEVAEPNGPRVAAWVLADYADRADAIFKKWLAKHDAEVAAKALKDAANDLRRLDDGRTGGYYEAGRHIIRRLDASADAIERSES